MNSPKSISLVLLAITALAPLRAQAAPPPPKPPVAQPITPPPASPLNPPPASPQPAAVPPAVVPDPTALKWDADTKEANPKPGELSVPFTFVVTNVSDHEVMINKLRTSCGCTVAQLPTTPYKLEPGANVSIAVTLDLRGKSGTLTKTVSVESSAGVKSLVVRANIPQTVAAATPGVPAAVPGAPGAAPITTSATPGAPGAVPGASAAVPGVPITKPGPTSPVSALAAVPSAPSAVPAANAMGDRTKNIQNAMADRQAVFKGDCATCHVEKGVGKLGADLYMASCGICHEAEHRATMVPDLKVPRSSRDLAFWQKWIAEGKPGTLMPAFAAVHGGSLTQEQADSLTVYLYQFFPRNPSAAAIPPPIVTAVPRREPSQTVEAQIAIGNSNPFSTEKP